MYGANSAHRPELYEEVKLFKNAKERERQDSLAELYAVIRCLEALEIAYTKDNVNTKEYTSNCSKLLTQYKQAFKQVKENVGTVEQFMKTYRMDCPAALERIREDKPLSVAQDSAVSGKVLVDITSLFITTMDLLKLEQKSVDQIQPYLRDLSNSLQRMDGMEGFEGSSWLVPWLTTLSTMQASDELSDSQIRQLSHDLDQVGESDIRADSNLLRSHYASAYASFNHFLETQRS